jgi:hypothetical protein
MDCSLAFLGGLLTSLTAILLLSEGTLLEAHIGTTLGCVFLLV